jgi:hypothetical protein
MTKPTTETTEPQATQEPEQRTKRARKPKAAAEPSGDTTAPETAPDAPSPRKRTSKAKAATAEAGLATERAAVPAKKPKTPKGGATLRELAERYIAHLEEAGKSEGTCFSYRMELRLAVEALGEDTPVAKITQADVAAFFESDPVTRTRSGVEKSPLSVAKTRRVLRQALTYGVEQGLIEKAPLPERA